VEAIGRAYFNLGQVLAELFRNREGVAVCERGRSTMRQRGALTFEWLIAAKEAEMLVELGSYQEAEALALETLGPQRPLLAPSATVFAQITLVRMFTRMGRYEEAEELLPELVTSARRMGGSMFLAPVLTASGELQAAMGRPGLARDLVEEAARLAFGSPAVPHWFRVIVPAARLLPPQQAEEYLDRIRSYPDQPWFAACRTEAAAVIGSDRALFKEAASLYESLELPYQTARCLLDAGEVDRGGDLAARYQLMDGPLASGLRGGGALVNARESMAPSGTEPQQGR
jgi:hypothetical protein